MLNMLQKGITPNDSIVTLKNTRALGIMPQIGFIFFDPFMTIDELEENIQYLKRAGEFTYLSLQMIDQLRVFKNTDYARKYAQAANFTSRAFCYSYNFTDIDVEKFFQRWQEAFGALRVQDMAIRNHLDQILLAGNYLRHTPLIDAYHKIVLAYNNVVITVLKQIANCCDTMHIIDTYKKMVCEVLLMLEMTIKSLQTNQ